MELVVGGDYEEIGRVEISALLALGLRPEHRVVDVGCGSGRLAFQLRDFLRAPYLGTDVLGPALDYARERCGRADWRFVRTEGPEIPAGDDSADFVTFFSVFTHLSDEETLRFLREAARVVKPQGRVVFSFLDFECEAHWPLFLHMADEPWAERVMNKFTTRAAVQRLVRAAGLLLEAIHEGPERWIPLARPMRRADGTDGEGMVGFGQSMAVASRFNEAAYLELHPDVRAAIAAGTFRSGAHHYDVCGCRERRALRAAG